MALFVSAFGRNIPAPRRFDGRDRRQAIKIILYIVGFFALIGLLVVGGCFKLVF